MPDVKHDVPPDPARLLQSRRGARVGGGRVDEGHHRGRHHVGARLEDAAHVVDGLLRAQVTGRHVGDAVRLQGDELVRVVGGGDPDTIETTELTRVLPDLVLTVHPQADQLEVGMTDDASQRVPPDVARAPLHDPVAHGRTVGGRSVRGAGGGERGFAEEPEAVDGLLVLAAGLDLLGLQAPVEGLCSRVIGASLALAARSVSWSFSAASFAPAASTALAARREEMPCIERMLSGREALSGAAPPRSSAAPRRRPPAGPGPARRKVPRDLHRRGLLGA